MFEQTIYDKLQDDGKMNTEQIAHGTFIWRDRERERIAVFLTQHSTLNVI